MKSARKIQFLLRLIDEAYTRHTWHGPNLRGSLRGLNARQAAWRPAASRHNVWEIVVHAAYWKYIVRRRLLGEKKGAFPLKGSNWFKRPEVINEKAWRNDIHLLETMQQSLCAAIAQLKPSDLHKKPQGSTFTNESIICGIANHDVYHAGQIQLLKRLMKS